MRTVAVVAAMLAASCVSAGDTPPLAEGPWGGEMVVLEITQSGGAKLRESCGEIAFDPIRPDAEGNFATRGRSTAYKPGPQPADEPADSTAVSVSGRIEGDTMVLQINEAGAPQRELTLRRGQRLKIVTCY